MATWDSTGKYMTVAGQREFPVSGQEAIEYRQQYPLGQRQFPVSGQESLERESLAMSAALDNQAQSSLDEREVLAKFGGWQNYNAWWDSLPEGQKPTNYAQVKAMIGGGPAPEPMAAAIPPQAAAAAAMPPGVSALAPSSPPTLGAGPLGSAMSGMAGAMGAAGSTARGLGAAARAAVPPAGSPSPGVDGTWPMGASWEDKRLAQPDGTWPMGAEYQDPMPKAGDGSWPQMQAPVPSHPMDLSGSPATIQPLTAGDGTWPMGAPWEDKRLAQPDGSWPMGAGNPMQGAGMGPLEYQHPMSPGLGMGALQFEDLAMAENPVLQPAAADSLSQPQSQMMPKILAEQTAPGQMSMLPGGYYSQGAQPEPNPLFPPFGQEQQPQSGTGPGNAPYVAGQQFHPGMFPPSPLQAGYNAMPPGMGGGMSQLMGQVAADPLANAAQAQQSGGYAPYVAGQQFNPQMFNQPPVPPGGFYPPEQGPQFPPFPQGDSFTQKDASRRFQAAAAKLNQ